MHFTDLFIKRPVLATVVSLVILLLGLKSIQDVELRQLPKLEANTITVSTFYAGASADLIQGFITTPLQQVIAQAEGIDYLTASNSQSSSTITAYLKLNYDPNKALTQVMAKVAQVRGQLPQESESPVIQASAGRGIALMYIGFYGDVMSPEQVTDYLVRVIQPRLETVDGVGAANVFGNRIFAMRIWLDPQKMASLKVTAGEVVAALRANNFLAAAGGTKGTNVAVNVGVSTDLHKVEDFEQIVVKRQDNDYVRIRDLATVELGSENYESSVYFSGEKAIFIGIEPAPEANPLEAVDNVKAAMGGILKDLPPGLHAKIAYDGSSFIRASIEEVAITLLEAGAIVAVVIFLFLGNLRSVVIPVIAIPLSLIGVVFFMWTLGYSLNLLTMLAMVLAIGLVVDDAIVVVENTHRHIEEGMAPTEAALQSAREIAGPVIAMTLTLAAVYAPIGFLGGLTGILFTEFAFTLAGAVLISGVVALTLSPMMCAKLLQPHGTEGGFTAKIDHYFEGLKQRYQRLLHRAIDYRPAVVTVTLVLLVGCPLLWMTSRSELAPTEDPGFMFSFIQAPPGVTLQKLEQSTMLVNERFRDVPEREEYFLVHMGAGGAFGGVRLKDWQDRDRSAMQILPELQQQLNAIPGVRVFLQIPPSLPVPGGGFPVQFVVTSVAEHRALAEVGQEVLAKAMASGNFMFLDTDLKFDTPRLQLLVDRAKAARLGIPMQEIGGTLATLLGGNYVSRFNLQGRAYKVIPQVQQSFRLSADQLAEYYVRAGDGTLVPLSSVVTITTTTEPGNLNQFQQLNSVTISGMIMPGKSLGDALGALEGIADSSLPEGFGIDYAGQSRQFKQEGASLTVTFFFAVIIIFLVLAALFESFRDPFIVLFSVPLSICGALIFISLGVGGASINIYTQIGLVTLVGLISKHGILMVDFANELQRTHGLSLREAIERAAGIRLRPVLMTTAAMVVGVVPLLTATGAGAASRFNIGLVVTSGMLIGTLFTLFVVPSMYTLFAARHQETALS
jgi:multidrug efflux pump